MEPQYPLDICNKPQAAVLDAVGRAPWRQVSTTKLRQIQTEQSVASGCPQGFKNLLDIEPEKTLIPARTEVFGTSTLPSVTVCAYRTNASDLTVGLLVGTVKLSGAQATALRFALAGAGTSGACPPQPSFILVLSPSGPNGPSVSAELGGCWRVERTDHFPTFGLGQAQPSTLLPLLAGLPTR